MVKILEDEILRNLQLVFCFCLLFINIMTAINAPEMKSQMLDQNVAVITPKST